MDSGLTSQAERIVNLQAQIDLLLKWKDEAVSLLGRTMAAELASARIAGENASLAQQIREITMDAQYFSTPLVFDHPADTTLWEVAAIHADGRVDRRIVAGNDQQEAQENAKLQRQWSGRVERMRINLVGGLS